MYMTELRDAKSLKLLFVRLLGNNALPELLKTMILEKSLCFAALLRMPIGSLTIVLTLMETVLYSRQFTVST